MQYRNRRINVRSCSYESTIGQVREKAVSSYSTGDATIAAFSHAKRLGLKSSTDSNCAAPAVVSDSQAATKQMQSMGMVF